MHGCCFRSYRSGVGMGDCFIENRGGLESLLNPMSRRHALPGSPGGGAENRMQLCMQLHQQMGVAGGKSFAG